MEFFGSILRGLWSYTSVASYAHAFGTRHDERLRDEPKGSLLRRLGRTQIKVISDILNNLLIKEENIVKHLL